MKQIREEKTIKLTFSEDEMSQLWISLSDSVLTKEGFLPFVLYYSKLNEEKIRSIDKKFVCGMAFCDSYLNAKIVGEFYNSK
jgi:hypothetical protein